VRLIGAACLLIPFSIFSFLIVSEQYKKDNIPQENLIASFEMDNSSNLKSDLNEIMAVFNNNGTRPSVVDNVALIINYFSDESNSVGLRNDICDDPTVIIAASLYEGGISAVRHQVVDLNKERGVSLYYYKADHYVIDGGSVTGPPIVIDPGKSRAVSTYFKVDRPNISGMNAIAWCPVLRFFDKDGHSYLTVCKGSMFASIKDGGWAGALMRYRPFKFFLLHLTIQLCTTRAGQRNRLKTAAADHHSAT
jgi:hypothetical protein